jgi:hypothetical protein
VLTGPGVRIEGIVVDLVAVFTFDDIWVPPDMVLHCVGSRPLALLSRRSLTPEGLIDVWGVGESGLGRGGDSPFPGGGGGGGGFGGLGAAGRAVTAVPAVRATATSWWRCRVAATAGPA